MASWKSTGTYIDEVRPPGANIVSGMWIFRVKRPPGSPPVFKARYVARGFSQRLGVDYFQTFSLTPKMTTLWVLLHVAAQRDYELHSLDFSTAFLQGSLHEEIWLRRPPGFTGSFPAGSQWSLRRPVYGLRQAPRERHDTLRTTLAALGFAPSTADPSLFLRTNTLLPPFYILVYFDDLVFATADTAGLAHVKSELQKRHTCPYLGELRSYLGLQITRDRARRTITLTQSHMVQQVLQRFDFTYSSPQATPLSTRHSLSALPSDESVEPSGPYPELVGCLMYLMTCTRPDLAYPLSILARYVAPRRHRPEHMAAAKRVLRYLCSTSGLGLVLGGRSPVDLTGHADASWVDDLATQRSSQGYTFSLVLYVDNKDMLALCREHRLEHRTKHIALRYFLARELQQRGQLRLAYVASQANTADIFTKALQPCDHQRYCTMLFSTSASLGLSPQQWREWLVWRARLLSGATRGGDAGTGGTGGTAAAGPRGARTRGTGAAGTGGVWGAGAGDPTEPGAARAGGSGASGAGAGGAGAGGTGAGGAGAVGSGARGTSAGGAGAGAFDPGGTVRPRPYFVPLLQRVLGVLSSTSITPPLVCPPPDQSPQPLQPASALPAPSPYTEQSGGLTEHLEPASRPVLPVRTTHRVPRSRPPPVHGTHAMALRPSSVPLPTVSRLLTTVVTDPSFESTAASVLVGELLDFAATCRLDYATALVAESKSASPPSVGSKCALGTDVLEDRQEDFECRAPAVPRFASMLLAHEGDTDAPDIPTPRSYVEAITGPCSSHWQAAMDAEMASWKSKGTYVDAVPSSQANIVDGMWIFRVKGPPGSPPAFKTFSPIPKMTTLWVLLQVAAHHDYELHCLDFSTIFLQGSLHEEIWLRCPPGFTGSFPVGTQWSLRRPVYGLRQAPREWHDTLRISLMALGFPPSTADSSLFLRTDTLLPPFYILVYVDDLVFATADTKELTLVKSELQKRHICTNLAPPSDEFVEPSGPYPELVGCLMYLMTCTRPDLAYPLSLLARYVAPGRHRKVQWDAAKKVLRYLCSTSSMGLVLGGRGPVVLTGHGDASWNDDSATQRSSHGYTFSLGSGSVSWRSTRSSSVLSSSCEAEIYAGAMAAQELRWLTYLLTDLGRRPRSPPVLYVDNKAMIALCQEHRLEHRTKHIALRYFLARDL
ncbi:unnamed protein product [Closterium sp. NIES-54]